jgi:hypothetical protein
MSWRRPLAAFDKVCLLPPSFFLLLFLPLPTPSYPFFSLILPQAYRVVLNDNCIAKETTKSPELIAKYSDIVLKKGNKHLDETEIETKLCDCVWFLFLPDLCYLFPLPPTSRWSRPSLPAPSLLPPSRWSAPSLPPPYLLPPLDSPVQVPQR